MTRLAFEIVFVLATLAWLPTFEKVKYRFLARLKLVAANLEDDVAC